MTDSLADTLPKHWQLKRLKFIARVQTGMAKGKDLADADTVEVPYLCVANVQDGYLALDDVATMAVPAADLDRYRLQPGDVLMNEGGDFDKLGRGHVWHGQIAPCIHQNHVFAVRPHGVSPEWLNAWTGSAPAQFYFMGRAKQSTNLASISSSNLMELPVPVPPPEEQVARLAFIARETARIDALIAKKTRFIALLREKRQALITQAVTRGLDPDVAMKDSGVEWLGRVPASWLCRKLKFWIADCGSGTTPSIEEDFDTGEGVPWVTTTELRETAILETERSISAAALGKYSALKLHPVGSLLIAMYGATVGRHGWLLVPATCNQACFAIHLSKAISTEYLTFVIDFANEPQEIEAAFKTFYRDAQVSDIQDANVVYDLKARLDGMLLYETDEVLRFAEAIVDDNVTHQKLYSLTQAPTDRFNALLQSLTETIAQWEAAWRTASDGDDAAAMAHAEAQRLELSTQRDKLIVFREGLGKFVRTYEYVSQLVDFADPLLEGFAKFARLLQKRLNGIPTEQVDLGELKLTHYRLKREGGIDGIRKDGQTPTLDPITDNGLREARDREKTYLSELIDMLNQALGKDVSDADQVALAVHVSEKLRGDAVLMAQVQNNPKDQAMRANLPGATVQALFGAMTAHQKSVTHLLSDEESRRWFLDVVYELLTADRGAALMQLTRGKDGF